MYPSEDESYAEERSACKFETRIEQLHKLAHKLEQKVSAGSIPARPQAESNKLAEELSPLNRSLDQVIEHFEDVISRIQL